jgi:hypothetical protein
MFKIYVSIDDHNTYNMLIEDSFSHSKQFCITGNLSAVIHFNSFYGLWNNPGKYRYFETLFQKDIC